MGEFLDAVDFRIHLVAKQRLAKQSLDDHLRQIQMKETASDAVIHSIPIVHIWELNTGGSQVEKREVWWPMAEAINLCLQAYGGQRRGGVSVKERCGSADREREREYVRLEKREA